MSKRVFPKLSLPPGVGHSAQAAAATATSSVPTAANLAETNESADASSSLAGGDASLASSQGSLSAVSQEDLVNGLPRGGRRNRPKPIMNLNGADLGLLKSVVQQQSQQAQVELQAQDSLADMTNAMKTLIEIKEDDLETITELGMGSGGTVFKVKHKATQMVMAKKIIHQIDAKTSKEIMRELQILNQCQSPEIIAFYGAYHHQGELCICMEFMDVGSLEMIAKMDGKLSEPVLAKILLSVLRGLTYLYEKHRIVHRDIKPSNILVNSQGRVKLCDFGVSGVLVSTSANTFVGTGAYMSPERIQGGKYATQGDTWSLGLTLIELVVGRYPFSAPDADPSIPLSVFELLQHIIQDPIPELPRGGDYSNEFCDCLNDMMVKDPTKRPTPMDLLRNHPYIKKAEGMRVDMLAWARSYLTTNLNDEQKKRLSISQQQKRISMAEKRRSMGIKVPPSGMDGLASGVAGMQLGGSNRRT